MVDVGREQLVFMCLWNVLMLLIWLKWNTFNSFRLSVRLSSKITSFSQPLATDTNQCVLKKEFVQKGFCLFIECRYGEFVMKWRLLYLYDTTTVLMGVACESFILCAKERKSRCDAAFTIFCSINGFYAIRHLATGTAYEWVNLLRMNVCEYRTFQHSSPTIANVWCMCVCQSFSLSAFKCKCKWLCPISAISHSNSRFNGFYFDKMIRSSISHIIRWYSNRYILDWARTRVKKTECTDEWVNKLIGRQAISLMQP